MLDYQRVRIIHGQQLSAFFLRQRWWISPMNPGMDPGPFGNTKNRLIVLAFPLVIISPGHAHPHSIPYIVIISALKMVVLWMAKSSIFRHTQNYDEKVASCKCFEDVGNRTAAAVKILDCQVHMGYNLFR